MSNWAAWTIISIICIGMLCLIAFIVVTIAESVQTMKRKKEEWKREDLLRGWRKENGMDS